MAFSAAPLRHLLVGLLLAAVTMVGVSSLPAAASPTAEDRLLALHNDARASAGLPPLQRDAGLDQVAAGWTVQMRDSYEAGGDRHAALRHNPNLAGQLPGAFQAASENVGFTVLTDASDQTLADRLHEGYMNSDGHRANIMGDYDRVGVAKRTASDGTMWSTVVFLASASPEPSPEPAPDPAPETEPAPEEDRTETAADGVDGEAAADGDAGPGEAPDPLTAEELFGDGWPDGLLSPGDISCEDLLARAAARFAAEDPAPAAPQIGLVP